MRRFPSWILACLAGGLLAVLSACATGAATPTRNPSSPPEFNVSGGSGSGTDITYRVRNESSGYTGYVNGSPLQAWQALIVVYNDLEIPINTLDSTSVTMGSTASRAPRELAGQPLHVYFDCGSGMSGQRADSYDVAYRLTSTVGMASGDSTAILTSLTANARSRDGASGVPVDCASTGRLEQRITNAARMKLAHGTPE